MLPPKFMAYRQLPDCNCEQCQKEDSLLTGVLEKKSEIVNTPQENTPTISEPSDGMKTSDSVTSVFGATSSSPFFSAKTSSSSSKFSFSTPQTKDFSLNISTPQNSTLKELLSKPSILSSQKSDDTTSTIVSNSPLKTLDQNKKIDAKSFSFTSQMNVIASPSTNIPSTGGLFNTSSNISIFDSPAPANTSGSMFGGKPSISIFGTNKPNSNIFGGANVATPVFGATTFTNTTQTEKDPLSNEAVFGSFDSSTASKDNITFSSLTQSNSQKEESDVVLKCDSSLSFASLAANTKVSLPVFASKSGKIIFY